MSTPPRVPTAWKHALLKEHGQVYAGGWWAPVVCTGKGSHPPALISFLFEDPAVGVVYGAPLLKVSQHRTADTPGKPGVSRDSIRFSCTHAACRRTPTVARTRWNEEIARVQAEMSVWLDVSALD